MKQKFFLYIPSFFLSFVRFSFILSLLLSDFLCLFLSFTNIFLSDRRFADDLIKVHKFQPTLKWRQSFENYLKTMPPYYIGVCGQSDF